MKYLFALLVLVLFALPQITIAQNDDEEEELIDPNQAKIDSLLYAIKTNSPDSVKAVIYHRVADIVCSYSSKLKYAFLSLENCSESDLQLIANNYRIIGLAYYMCDESEKALPYNYKAAELYRKLAMPAKEALTYNGIGNCYEDLNIVDSIFYFYNKAMKIFSDIKDTSNISYTYCLMGRIFYNMDLIVNAEETYQQALHYASLANDTLEMAACYNFLAIIISKQSDTSVVATINYYKKAVSLFESINTSEVYYLNIKNESYSSLAESYIKAAKLTGNNKYADSCYMYIKKVGNFYLTQGQLSDYVNDRYNYVEYLLFHERYRDALAELLRVRQYVKEETSLTNIKDYHFKIYEVYSLLGDYKNALKHFVTYDSCRFSLLNDNTLNSLKNAEVERTRMLEELKLENAEKLHASEKRRMHVTIISLWVGLGLVLVVIGLVIRVLVIKKRANDELSAKNALLSEQKEEIESQHDTIKAQRDEIQASINYARRIQHSMLPPEETISHIFPDYFLLYKPRDIVSGDFYWVGQFGDNKVCIVADCTGHGVPGGFLSVLGMSNLNHIVKHTVAPDVILNRLRESIIANLRQSDNLPAVGLDDGDFNSIFSHNYDGMDAAVYVINERSMKLSFAGANNPLLLIRNGEVEVVKANKMPVGIYAKLDSFESVDVEIKKGDCLYTFSDGFQDQFGDGTHDKFTAKRLRELLLEIHKRPMSEQKDILNRTFEKWRGAAENQTDDVLIMGVRI